MLRPRSRSLAVSAAIILTAALILSGCGLAKPSLGYQGVLTDAAGQPVPDGTYDMMFRLYEINYTGSALDPVKDPVQVFTYTAAVQVTDGVFDATIGDQAVPIPVEKMGQEMELEIAVKSGATYETLSPRQPLVGAPYAFSLYPGAHITDVTELDGPTLSISKDPTFGPVLRLDGALESTQPSYTWVSPQLAVEEANLDFFDFFYEGSGELRVTAKSSGAYNDILIPLSMPGTLLGQDVTLDSVRVYYGCSGDCAAAQTRIRSLYVNRADPANAGGLIALKSHTNINLYSSNASYTTSGINLSLGSSALQTLTLRMYLDFLDTNDIIRIRGVRLGFTHQ